MKKAKPTKKTSPPNWKELNTGTRQLVTEIIESIADKWTMLIIEELEEHRTVRFKQLGRLVPGISQKMLTQTLRQMESDGVVKRTVYPEVPPRVEYELTKLGHSLGEALCGLWLWAEKNRASIERARAAYAKKHPKSSRLPT